MKNVLKNLIFLTTMIATPFVASAANIYNYLGTGYNPSLSMTLASNEAGSGSYTIGYGGYGGLPIGWSSWNIVDVYNNNAYYGNITVNFDGKTLSYVDYTTEGTNGNYLSGINVNNSPQYSLSVDSVVCSYCN